MVNAKGRQDVTASSGQLSTAVVPRSGRLRFASRVVVVLLGPEQLFRVMGVIEGVLSDVQ